MTTKILKHDYHGRCVSFDTDGWLNASNAASLFGKVAADWLELDLTKEYIGRMAMRAESKVAGSSLIPLVSTRISRGSTREIWLHPKLAIKFARWLSVDFEMWCDEQLEALVLGEVAAQLAARRHAAMSFRSVCEALSLTHEAIGKTTKPHHYMNEARLINEVLTGAFAGRNRDCLTLVELELVMLVENRDMLLLGQGKDYQARKAALSSYVKQLRSNHASLGSQ
ncbi:KilA-N domain-containing protein [Pseudomonas turukhanskensis]|uniref:KilA-N domain-containing protein n=1 Tax=Pseudomonas turukhanskensis TaxID=1806536 RepID=A0A9W6K8G3_9PSED|nr:KilA-N domain-containing protein [Pseudomonas turukhanskensis]GLK89999.1 hypothetical protein GCM10017655_30610 [Pseudomonas turukhanskensis]